ncbi:vWA domain-containing protein [Acuticoccus sp.]|uniref:vWA domain-containing protein n=1 Tax=Acuticoccus sp. TaxID=1904378 RepID=UPI003B52CA4D
MQLVLDRSGSMLDVKSEGRTKAEVLRKSATVLADVAPPEMAIGATTYDEDAQDFLAITLLGDRATGAGRATLRGAITGYAPNASGFTATGDGIERAKLRLEAATGFDNRAMIVLTDGKDTAAKSVAEVADGVIDSAVFAIGLGTAEQIDPGTLTTLAGAPGGYMLMTGLLTSDDQSCSRSTTCRSLPASATRTSSSTLKAGSRRGWRRASPST